MTVQVRSKAVESATGSSTSGLVPSDLYLDLVLGLATSVNLSVWHSPLLGPQAPWKFVGRFTGALDTEQVLVAMPATDKLEPTVSETGEPLRWLQYVASRLRTMSERRDDAELPVLGENVVARAYDDAYHFFPPNVPPPSVGTTTDGGVEFAWHRGGWDVELEISPSDELTFWAYKRESGESFSGLLRELLKPAYELLLGLASTT
jgi:hypothetical protein